MEFNNFEMGRKPEKPKGLKAEEVRNLLNPLLITATDSKTSLTEENVPTAASFPDFAFDTDAVNANKLIGAVTPDVANDLNTHFQAFHRRREEIIKQNDKEAVRELYDRVIDSVLEGIQKGTN